MIDILDIFAFVVIAVLFLTVTAIIVALGSLPDWIACKTQETKFLAATRLDAVPQ
jgi:hypothetical protein